MAWLSKIVKPLESTNQNGVKFTNEKLPNIQALRIALLSESLPPAQIAGHILT